MRYLACFSVLLIFFRDGYTQYSSDYTGCSFMSTCDVMHTLRAEMDKVRPTKELQAIKVKMEYVVQMEYEFKELKFQVEILKEKLAGLSDELRIFKEERKNVKTTAQELKLLPEDDGENGNKIEAHESRLNEVEQKLNKVSDNNDLITTLQAQVKTLHEQLKDEKRKHFKAEEEKVEQDKILEETRARLVNLQNNFTKSQQEQQNLLDKIEELNRIKHLQENLHLKVNLTSNSTATIIQDFESLQDSFTSIIETMDNKTAENRYEIHRLSTQLSNQSNSIEILQDIIRANDKHFNETTESLFKTIRKKVEVEDFEYLTNITNTVFGIVNMTSIEFNQLKFKVDDSGAKRRKLETELKLLSTEQKKLEYQQSHHKQKLEELSDVKENIKNIKNVQEELGGKVGNLQETVEKIQTKIDKPQMDDDNDLTKVTPKLHETPKQRDSCMYYQTSSDVVASINGRPIQQSVLAVEDGKILTFRCKNVGSFRFHGSQVRQCRDGRWSGNYPVCGPLVAMAEVEAGNVSMDATPSIIIEPEPDSASTGVLPNGVVVVTEGSSITLSCLFNDRSKLQWSVNKINSDQQQVLSSNWNAAKSRSEVRITTARESNSRNYTCSNKNGGSHTVTLLVQSVTCQPPILNELIQPLNNPTNKMNSEVDLQCTKLNYYMEWPDQQNQSPSEITRLKTGKVKCLPSGKWSRDWPNCVPRNPST